MLHDVVIPSEKAMPIVVLLCGDLADLGQGLDLEELDSSLKARFPNITVDVVPDLCRHPGQISPVVARGGAVRVVLGLCSSDYSQIELQAQARKVGLDPFGLEVVLLGTLCSRVHTKPQATRKARILLAAAIARTQAFQGSGPENSKLYFLSREQKVTRRALFTMPPVGYLPVPSIHTEQCAVERGCRLCARACPREALREISGHLSLDKNRCEGCGICLGACPREAIDFPGWSLPQFEAQLTALLGSKTLGAESLGLLFTCQRAFNKLEEIARRGVSYSHQWLPVVVPCLKMVTPAWILQSLAHGADAVALLSCGAECLFGQARTIGGRVNYCRRLLRLLGETPDHVKVLNASRPEKFLQTLQEPPLQRGGSPPSKPEELLHLNSLKGTFEAIKCLAGAGYSLSEVVLEHPHSPFGVLELQAEGCTGCLACVEACPTKALASERAEDEVTVTYVASSCNGCGMCADVCPETDAQVLRVNSVTNLEVLSRDRVVLHEDRLAICESCGASIASQKLLQRIEGLFEGGNEALRTALRHYCPSCRLSFAWGTKSSST